MLFLPKYYNDLILTDCELWGWRSNLKYFFSHFNTISIILYSTLRAASCFHSTSKKSRTVGPNLRADRIPGEADGPFLRSWMSDSVGTEWMGEIFKRGNQAQNGYTARSGVFWNGFQEASPTTLENPVDTIRALFLYDAPGSEVKDVATTKEVQAAQIDSLAS